MLHLTGVTALAFGIAALGDGAAVGLFTPGRTFTMASLDFHVRFPNSFRINLFRSSRIVKISQMQ